MKIKPVWYEQIPPPGSYRTLFKWGSLSEFKHPNPRLCALMEDVFNLSEEDLRQPIEMGLETVNADVRMRLSEAQLANLRQIVGEGNCLTDTYNRLKASYGKGMIDSIRLRKHLIENVPDVVLYPRTQTDVQDIVRYCHAQKIPIYVRGGGSSVTRGTEAVCGGISLDLSVHLNQVVSFNETNQTITVQAGMMGPQLEDILNHAPQHFAARQRYTCGHFPQSFEYSSVGGWVVTKGAGQNSTYYGKIEDIVAAQEYVTPVGVIQTQDYPRSATGPDFNQILMGSEGAFGVLVNVTLKIFRHMPENRRYFSYMFKSWEAAKTAVREIMQCEAGRPSVFRLSDAEETDVAMKLYGVEDTPANFILERLGYRARERCLFIGTTDGESGFTRNVQRALHTICTRQGAFNLTPFRVAQRWEKDRWRDPYMREDLQDYGIITDTLECAVTWEQLEKVHSGVRQFIKSRPQTICMTHLSHAYPQGGNLYFTFIAKITSLREYLDLQYGVLDAIQKHGAAMSHHHGVGKQTSPWLEGQVGSAYLDLLRSLKAHFDPHNIMNPGGTLALDMSAEQKQKTWGMSA